MTHRKNETNKVCIPYCIFSLSYVNHSYILKEKVVAFAEKEKDEESEVFQVEEIKDQEEYRNLVPKGKGRLPVPPKSDFILRFVYFFLAVTNPVRASFWKTFLN